MKFMYSILFVSILFLGCKQEPDQSAVASAENDKRPTASVDEVFKKNSQTVMENLKGWQNENLDYSMYSPDFVMYETGFGSEKDSINLEEMKAFDKQMWDAYDFKLLTSPPMLLPGVDKDTKLPDGSVRHYSEWEVTKTPTDPKQELRKGVIKLYESFDFDKDGKINYQQVYGDFTGLMMYLNGKDEMMTEKKS